MKKRRQPKRTHSHDRQLRKAVFDMLANSDHEPKIAIAQMDMYVQWIKTGVIPGVRILQVVSKSEQRAGTP